MSKAEITDDQLTQCRKPRQRDQTIGELEIVVAHLRQAQHVLDAVRMPSESLDLACQQQDDKLEAMIVEAGGQVFHRKRPKIKPTSGCTVFIDECGSHKLSDKDKYKAFALAAVIVQDCDLENFQTQWKDWKIKNLGSGMKLIHEPDVRGLKGAFFLNGDKSLARQAVGRLDDIISRLPFSAVVGVINRPRYIERYGEAPMDESLPTHPYQMTLNFVMERVAMALQCHHNGAKASVVFESRGAREDAEMQYAFARLFLKGTSYVSPGYFRLQFFPGLAFKSKSDNLAGLQIADLLARPCADKVLDPNSTPPRWEAFKAKLCAGRGTQNSTLGLKVVPWDARLESL